MVAAGVEVGTRQIVTLLAKSRLHGLRLILTAWLNIAQRHEPLQDGLGCDWIWAHIGGVHSAIKEET